MADYTYTVLPVGWDAVARQEDVERQRQRDAEMFAPIDWMFRDRDKRQRVKREHEERRQSRERRKLAWRMFWWR